MKHQKICLPSLLFQYLKESILKTRTTANEQKKVPNYIPFGRLLSDIFTESGLVGFLESARCTEDLEASAGEAFNVRNLRNMGVMKDIIVDPVPEAQQEVLGKRLRVDDFPLFSKNDNPEVIPQYIFMIQEEGVDVSGFRYEDLPDGPDLVDPKKKKKKKKRKAEGEEQKKKHSKKHKKEKVIGLSSDSEASAKVTSDKGTSTQT